MKLKDIYKSEKPVISFEISSPKSEPHEYEEKVEVLLGELKILSEFNPSFISVTYGAGGSTRDKTLDIVLKVRDKLGLCPVPHFTCVGASRLEILDYLKLIQNADIKNILALRGDPPRGEVEFKKPKDGFGYANELVEFIKSNVDLSIAVAGYPEKHPQCPSFEEDILNLKRKVDAGADVILTQLFFDNKYYFNFVEKAQKAGINIPIVPGIMPIINFTQIERMASLCSATIPDKLLKKLQENKDNNKTIKEIGIEYAINQCRELLESKVPGLHVYILNKSYSAKKILSELNLASITS